MILSALNSSCNNTEASRMEREWMGRWEKKTFVVSPHYSELRDVTEPKEWNACYLFAQRLCNHSLQRRQQQSWNVFKFALTSLVLITLCFDSTSPVMSSHLQSATATLFVLQKKPEIVVHSGTEDRCTAKAFHIAITLWRDNCWLYQQSTASSGLVFIRIISRRRVEQ